jgi:hypothetical protein
LVYTVEGKDTPYKSYATAKAAVTRMLKAAQEVAQSAAIAAMPPSETVTVIRIENKLGKGMYNSGNDSGGVDPEQDYRHPSLFTCPGYQNNKKHHPCPEDDSLLREQLIERGLFDPSNYSPSRMEQILFGMYGFTPKSEKYSYGFANAAQARHWLYKDEWLQYLDSNGFHVAVITLPASEVLIGNTQAMFIKPKHYEQQSIKEFFKLA